MANARVRYMINEIDPAIDFYTKHLGFEVKMERRPNFAMLIKDNLELILSTNWGPGSAAKPMFGWKQSRTRRVESNNP